MYGTMSYILGMPTAQKSARLDARITPDLLDQLRRVAETQGRSVSDYVTTALQDAVRKDIADMEVIRLSRAASDRFAAALISPPELSPAMRRALNITRRW